MSGHLNPDFPYPAGHRPEPNPCREISAVFDTSDAWDMGAWSGPSLVVTRAALKHMLTKVEREMGQRQLLPPTRGMR